MPDVFFLFLFPQFFLKSNYFIQIWWNLSLWHCLCSILGMCEWRRQAAARRGSARVHLLLARRQCSRLLRVYVACAPAAHAQLSERAVKQSFSVTCREWTCQSYNKRMNKRTHARTNERTNQRTNEWTNEQTNERTNERMNGEQTNRKSEGKSVFESFKLLDYTNF